MILGCLHVPAECLERTRLCFQPSFLCRSSGGSRWCSKYLGSCHQHGRCRWSSWQILVSVWPALYCWGHLMREPTGGTESHSLLSLLLWSFRFLNKGIIYKKFKLKKNYLILYHKYIWLLKAYLYWDIAPYSGFNILLFNNLQVLKSILALLPIETS